MRLSELLRGTDIALPKKDADIAFLSYDSRRASAGGLHFCIPGTVMDGHAFCIDAYANGCRYFVVTHAVDLPRDAVLLRSIDVRRDMAIIASNLSRHVADRMTLIAVTGTKGKTTTALLLRHILERAGIPTGYIGTNGVEYGDVKIETHNTTPESVDLCRYFSSMDSAGYHTAVLEVSSQAILMNRVSGLTFDTCVFTNLSPDHIGPREHADFDEYRECKHRLFTEHNARHTVVNADDENAAYMCKGAGGTVLTCSERDGDFCLSALKLESDKGRLGVSFTLTHGNETVPFLVPMPGAFNAQNAMLAAAVASVYGIGLRASAEALADIRIKGRFECIEVPCGATVVIDYAHNGTSLSSLLSAIRAYRPHRLLCLFGSVGGRTRGRRAELALAAGRVADLCILTSDNPDNEPPERIIDEIAASFPEGSCPFEKIPDRAEAIRHAVSLLERGDVLVLAGKGHENYQLIAGEYVPFSEREIVLKCLDAQTV